MIRFFSSCVIVRDLDFSTNQSGLKAKKSPSLFEEWAQLDRCMAMTSGSRANLTLKKGPLALRPILTNGLPFSHC